MIRWQEPDPEAEELGFFTPIGVILSADGTKTVVADRALAEEAAFLDALPAETVFAPETTEALLGRLEPYLTARNAKGEISAAVTFRMQSPGEVDRSVILPSTRRLSPEDGFENLTDCGIDSFDLGLLCFGTVEDGRILSVASENPSFGGTADIGVETAPGYEGRGYAASNAAALAAALLESGREVTYTVEDGNAASCRVAEKAGFSLRERDFWIVGFFFSEGDRVS